ncbi:MAG: PIN domain-containing protein [Candidatus Cryptobacteroides sp.]
MKYLLDTNICIHLFRGNYSIAEFIQEKGWENCCISEISKAELLLGEEIVLRKGRNVPMGAVAKFVSAMEVVPISGGIELFAREKARLIYEGLRIEDFDLLIACTAVSHNYVLVSENLKHLSRIQSLCLENWAERG